MSLTLERDVLLFFEDYDHDTFWRNDRRIRRVLRKTYHALRRERPKVTGFEVWFLLLRKALERVGRRVHVNAHRLAARHPDFPIGVCGYPHGLEGWKLPNPAVLGPGMFDHPSLYPHLLRDSRFRLYVTTCDWNHAMFAPVYGEDRCVHWHAGIDLDEWPNLSDGPKDIDVLVYDKVRWHRDELEKTLIQPALDALRQRGLEVSVIRYGRYDHAGYRKLLGRSRSLFFLCEHETQGMAYQEAMASGLPVIAWDPGTWVDPQASRYDSKPIPACSVPFFDATCGERFARFDQFEETFERFWTQRGAYAPREFVRRRLSLAESAELYLGHLARAQAVRAGAFQHV
jgi:glycosyltransferase involved in cell wall biosynthesis